MDITHDLVTPPMQPADIRRIDAADLRASLRDGWADFNEKRGDILMLGLLYPLVGFVVALFALGTFRLELLFPVFAGLTLLGPLVAVGFYEIARRRERGEATTWNTAFDIVHNPSAPAILGVGAGLFVIFGLWMIAAAVIYTVFMGPTMPSSVGELLTRLFTTGSGWAMMIVGNLVGLVLATIVLAVSVVSLPMLVDRRVSAADAVWASIAAFRTNTATMLRWGVIVAVLLIVGAIPALIGLAVVLPVLGYATWHLYTRIVERGEAPPVT